MIRPYIQAGLKIAARYAAAVGAEFCAYWLRHWMIEQSGGDLPPFITFYPVTILATYLLGFGPGLLATLSGVLIVDLLMTPPIGSLHIGRFQDVVSLMVFVVATIFTNCAFAFGRRHERRAAAFEQELSAHAMRAKLDDSMMRLRLASDAAEIGYWSWSLSEGALDVDDGWRRIHGVEPGAPVDFSLWEGLLHPESRHASIEALRRSIDEHRDFVEDYRLLRANGEARWVMARGRVDYDERGVATRFSGVCVDVTARKSAEIDLQQSRLQLRVTLESIGDAVLSCDERRSITFLNPVASALSGWTVEEAVGRSIDDIFRLVNEVTGEPAEDIVGRVLREGRSMALANHTALRRRNGELLPIEDSVAPMRDASGQITGVVLVFHDVAERRRAIDALRLAEDRYRTIVEFLPTPILLQRRRSVEYMNPACCRLFGVENGEVYYGRSPLTLFHPSDHPAIIERIAQLEKNEPVSEREERIVRSDGEIRLTRVVATPLKDSRGDAIMVVLYDLSEQRRIESSLRYYELMSRNSRDAMFCLEKESGRLVIANQAAAALYGYDVEEMQNLTIYQLRANAEIGLTRPQMEQAFENGILFETLHRRRNGECFPVEINSRGSCIDGVECLISVVRDISDRKNSEAMRLQNEKLVSVGRMAAAVAHEFNNLLQIVQASATELSEQHCADEAAQQRLSTILDAGRRAAQLTNQLLTFSRKSVVDPRLLTVDEAINEMDGMLRRLISGRALLLIRLNAPGAQTRIDPRQFEQSLVNLVLNARDASTKDGRIDVESELRRVDRETRLATGLLSPGEYVVVRVVDRGCGMDAHTLSHLFEPFFTTKELGHGAGMGLVTVGEMARGVGGQVEVESQSGVGTRMSLYLPLHARAAKPSPTVAAPPLDASERTVLLVEDEKVVRMLVREHLASFGYRVLEAGNGVEGLRVAREHLEELSLVVSDMMMPQMDGREMSRQLRELAPDLKILIISGYADGMLSPDETEQLKLRFLSKPFTKKALADMLRSIFGE